MKVLGAIGRFFKSAWQFIFFFRRVFMAIPVGVAAYLQAKRSLSLLPLQVGILLAKDGSYARLITRDQAVYYPLAITGICLLCMFCSRKAFYPWLISVVTLVIPTLILLLNQLF